MSDERDREQIIEEVLDLLAVAVLKDIQQQQPQQDIPPEQPANQTEIPTDKSSL